MHTGLLVAEERDIERCSNTSDYERDLKFVARFAGSHSRDGRTVGQVANLLVKWVEVTSDDVDTSNDS